ncbi:serine/threonine protein kinase [Ancylothrix sp. C2]|uniref:serine/threonine-protein kinase n=1 Tax=Ancylothrix sp. D3o TaxID=2953691 RepID=UPI0021BB1A07|nr:serine/threonine-protein kinase [Ancylothrix sp. D3o]MCT7950864.1 serine/threonine protein kinase [Ancylothrix sp. D3o]
MISYCLNPECSNPQNPDNTQFCKTCGSNLFLKNRYRAISPIGEGGFGRTFIAEDNERLNASCVIKQFLPLSQVQQNVNLLQKATEMFTQEARQLLQLGNHPQIPTLFADLEQEGRLYLVQEFINGQNLLEELEQRGAFSGEEIEELLLDLLPVLKYIHSAGVIHRDIKPENIIRRRVSAQITPKSSLTGENQSSPHSLFLEAENSLSPPLFPPGLGEDLSAGKFVLIDFGVAKNLTGSVLVKTGTKIGTEGYAPIEQLRGGKAYPASDLYSLGVTCIHLLTNTQPDELYNPINGKWLWREALMKIGNFVSERLGKVIDKLLPDIVSERYQSAEAVLADLAWMPINSAITKIQVPGNGKQKTWRCIHTLAGHTNYVIGVAISPDNKTLASCSYDKSIKVWHLNTGNIVGTLLAHTGWISCVAISPDGKTLVSGSLDNTLRLWELGTGTLKTTLTGHTGYVISVAISPDGQILASGSFDNIIKLWNLNTGIQMGTLTGHTGYIESLAISPDGKILASGGGFDDNIIKLWDLKTGNLIHSFNGHKAAVRSLAFTPDSQKLASGSEDKTIKLWDLNKQTEIYSLNHPTGWVQAIAISPNGEILASGSRDTSVKLWNLENGQLLHTLKWHSGPVTSLAFSPDGTKLASGSWDYSVKIWQAE